jgi:hypothetical protein
MISLDAIFLFLLLGEYQMDDREIELSEVREETYKLYQREKREFQHLKDMVRRLH